jgi:hypothetical protein
MVPSIVTFAFLGQGAAFAAGADSAVTASDAARAIAATFETFFIAIYLSMDNTCQTADV